jgi:AAA+ superfamily predicted ATPase
VSDDPRLTAFRDALTVAVRAYLQTLRERWDGDAGGGEVERVVAAVGVAPDVSGDDRTVVHALLAGARDGRFAALAARLGLSTGEQALAASAWWAEVDPQFALVLGVAHDDASRRRPSAALVALLLEPFGIDAPAVAADHAPLVRLGVLEPGAGAAGPLELTPSARTALAGLDVGRAIDAGPPAPRLAGAVQGLARHLSDARAVPAVLRGPIGVGRHAVTAAAAARLGLVAVHADRPVAELRLIARGGLGVPVVPAERLPELDWRPGDGPLVAVAASAAPIAGAHVVDLPGPDAGERRLAWAAALADAGVPEDVLVPLAATLSGRFAFTDQDIVQVVARAQRDAHWHRRPLSGDDVWEAARRQPEHMLRRLASLVTPAFTLDDLVLSEDTRAQLAELVAHVELQHLVLDGWGFRRRLPRGQGVIAVFTGPPGTGKTMAAEAVAHALRHDLYRVDLSAVVSKYVGETEKNLAVAFDEAERASAVLLFDEADALFGKRTEVRDSHDRYANLEVSYLLQRVETFTGLVILATNRRAALDEAFLRRLRFVIGFDLPDAGFRAELWRRSFPPEAAVEELDWDALAAAELSGGSIQGAALSAAYLAAAADESVTAEHVEHALRREHAKLGRAWTGVR